MKATITKVKEYIIAYLEDELEDIVLELLLNIHGKKEIDIESVYVHEGKMNLKVIDRKSEEFPNEELGVNFNELQEAKEIRASLLKQLERFKEVTKMQDESFDNAVIDLEISMDFRVECLEEDIENFILEESTVYKFTAPIDVEYEVEGEVFYLMEEEILELKIELKTREGKFEHIEIAE